jgi:hypothetical protein
MASNTNQKLAGLIDADNAQASVIRELLEEVTRYGTATIMRAYGDWTTTNLKCWKAVLHTMAVQPIQQFSDTSGKNATDSALVIDAMDVLHTGLDDGWATLSALGSQLNRNHPSFDSRNDGVTKLCDLMRKQTFLETKEVVAGESSQHVHLYVRRKQPVAGARLAMA